MQYVVDSDRCVACLACARVCPAEAVEVEEARVAIEPASCTQCGACVPSCPHDAIDVVGELGKALQLAAQGRASLILSVESAAFFYPATPEQVVNACYAAGFPRVHRGVYGDELVAREYLKLWHEEDWGTLLRSSSPVVVKTVRQQFPELVPYLAPVVTPPVAEARYLRAMYGEDLAVVYVGLGLAEEDPEIDAAITFEELDRLFQARGVVVARQPQHYDRVPDERARHLSIAGGLPLALLTEERHTSRRFRKFRGVEHLEMIARAVAVDRIDLGFVDILPFDGNLDHPVLGSHEELFWRRAIVAATEPVRSSGPVVDERVPVELGATFELSEAGKPASDTELEAVLDQIGLGPNGKPWDCGACGYATCRQFAEAQVRGRTTLRMCLPYQERRATEAEIQADQDELTGLATYRALRTRLAHEVARSGRSGEPFSVLFVDLDQFKEVNDHYGHSTGNEVLRAVAAEILESVRSTDLAARYGGDEFVVVLVRTTEEGARRVAEALREGIAAVGRKLGLPDRSVTASIGVAAYGPQHAHRQPDDLLVAADQALYTAKASGRDSVA